MPFAIADIGIMPLHRLRPLFSHKLLRSLLQTRTMIFYAVLLEGERIVLPTIPITHFRSTEVLTIGNLFLSKSRRVLFDLRCFPEKFRVQSNKFISRRPIRDAVELTVLHGLRVGGCDVGDGLTKMVQRPVRWVSSATRLYFVVMDTDVIGRRFFRCFSFATTSPDWSEDARNPTQVNQKRNHCMLDKISWTPHRIETSRCRIHWCRLESLQSSTL